MRHRRDGWLLIAAFVSLLAALALGAHAFTNINLTSTDRDSVYAVVINGRPTGTVLSGEYVYSSGKALVALFVVPLAVVAGVLMWGYSRRLRRDEAFDRALPAVYGGGVALPVYAIGFANEMGVVDPIVAAGVSGTSIALFYGAISFGSHEAGINDFLRTHRLATKLVLWPLLGVIIVGGIYVIIQVW